MLPTPTMLLPADTRYPPGLRDLASPPALHVVGTVTEADALALAIVGSRRPTVYGLEVAERLAADLAARGVTIVSGFARGIDTAAHRAALGAGGRTLAILGSGVDVVYPPENAALAVQVARSGALLSQFPAGTPPFARNFPPRNRTLAALVLGVVVVEAAERSGALITAGHAGDLGREVFAIPGKITSATSAGCNRLIIDGAKLVQHWSDIVQELPERWRRRVTDACAPAGAATRPGPGTDEARMLDLLSVDEPRHIERLIGTAGLSPARAGAILTALELGGWARQLGGQRWVAAGPRARRA